jgi:site-specific DNA recombinase
MPMKRFAIYARHSTHKQNELSTEDQLAACRDEVKKLGGIVVEEYQDPEISGDSMYTRPGILKLMKDANNHKFDVVLAESTSRLSRRPSDMSSIIEQLEFLRIVLRTTTESVISAEFGGIMGVFNANQLKQIAASTKRGQISNLKRGKSTGGKAYGYDQDKSILDSNGKIEPGHQKINDAQADIVRRIYDMYIGGMSAKKIAMILNNEGVSGPQGGPWNASTVSGSRGKKTGILHNPLYVGIRYYNVGSWPKNPATGKRASRINPESEHYHEKVPVLRIVSDEQWNAVKEIQQKNSGLAVSKRRRPSRLFSGITRCGICGGTITVIGTNRYGCSTHQNRGKGKHGCTNNKTISSNILETRVLEGLKHHMMDPDLVAEYIRTFHSEMKKLSSQKDNNRIAAEKEYRENSKKIDNIVEAIMDGNNSSALQAKSKELSNRQKILEQELSEPEASNVIAMHPSLPDQYQQTIKELQAALNSEDMRDEAGLIIRSLIDEIVLTPLEGRGNIDIKIVGDLAAILGLGATPKNTSTNAGVMKWLVAGAGFEPATFRL